MRRTRLFLATTMLVLLRLTCQAKDNHRDKLIVHSLSYRVIPYESTSHLTTPGTSNTQCYGSGSDSGYSTTITMNCQTVTTPPTDVPITNRWYEVYNLLEANGVRYTVTCNTRWMNSKCAWLTPGDSYPAELNSTTMWLTYRKGGNMGKLKQAKFRILGSRSEQLPSVATAQTAGRAEPQSVRQQPNDVATFLRLPKLGVPFLLQGDELTELEIGEAMRVRVTSDSDLIFYVPGSASTVRTRSVRPVLVAQSGSLPELADKLELYRLEVKDGERQLLWSRGQTQVAVPIPIIATRLSTTLYQFAVNYDLTPGEYAFSARGSNQVFLFEIH